MLFGRVDLSPQMQTLYGEVEKTKQQTIERITETANEIKEDYVQRHEGMEGLRFEIKIGDATPSAKHDIVNACYDFKADSLFLGAKGLAHSFRQRVEKSIRDHVGSVPDYALHHAPCDVMIVKPAEY